MLDMFEKLINEHGSAVILKERIELINDRYEALETKLTNSEKENELLKTENKLLVQQLQQLEKQVNDSTVTDNVLPNEQVEILRILFSSKSAITKEILAHKVNLDMGILIYHMDELQAKELIEYPRPIMGSPLTGKPGTYEYSISQSGRKYVAEVIGT